MHFFVFVVVVNEGNSECFVQNSREPWKGFNRGKIKNKICLSPLSFYDHLVAKMPTSQDLKFTNFVISILSVFSYQINVSVKSKLQHSPPTPPPPTPGNPPGIWLFWKLLFKFPPTWAKMLFKCPTLGSIQVIKCPRPGDISQAHKWQKDSRNAFSCQKNLQV